MKKIVLIENGKIKNILTSYGEEIFSILIVPSNKLSEYIIPHDALEERVEKIAKEFCRADDSQKIVQLTFNNSDRFYTIDFIGVVAGWGRSKESRKN